MKAYFKKNFDKPTKGIESNILKEVPTLYKRFRRTFLKGTDDLLTKAGLESLEAALKENKDLYRDEADFLLRFIFEICKYLFLINQKYFEESKHSYVVAYKENIKGIVAIDEATDFSVWELGAISSLAHPYFNSVTLCGDLMQRMTNKGITSWDDFKEIIPNSEVRDLKIAYRQTAKLLAVASEVYQNCVGKTSEFIPYHQGDELDPEPLFFIGDEESKIEWIVNRILEINTIYENSFPTVALFVKNDLEVLKLTALLENRDELEENGIGVTACVQGKILGNNHDVRIFSIEYIKGLEFGAVFFIDLDDMQQDDQDMLNKYLYVGLSRANLFLGMTLQNGWPNEMKYLEPFFKDSNWKR